MTALSDESATVIKHAKRRINELEGEFKSYVETHPCKPVVEPNADGTKDTHKLKIVKAMPPEFALLTLEIVSSLRSALDRAGYAITVAAWKASGKLPKHTHFPFGDTPLEVESRRGEKARSRDLPKEIFDVMVALEPYERGDDGKEGNLLLWGLNKLCNTKKHEVLVPHVVAAFLGGYHFQMSGGMSANNWPPRWDSVKQEMEIATIPRGATFEGKFQIGVGILIGDVKGIGGQPAIDVLRAVTGEVERSLMTIEAEARRLGYFT